MTLEMAISVERLTRWYGDKAVIDDISFSVERGTITGFLGANGAGKTTTIKMLLGLLRPAGGRINVIGYPVPDEIAQVRSRIGVLLENNGIYGRLKVSQNLHFFGEAYGLSVAETEVRSRRLMHWLGLDSLAERRVSDLSTGERRKLGIARVFLHDPELILLDEPTLGLDIESALSLRDALLQLAKERSTTVFLTTHQLTEVERLCDRVVVLRDGRVAADTTPRALAERSRQPVVNVRAENLTQAALDAVLKLPGVKDLSADECELRVSYENNPDSAALVRTLASSGVAVVEVRSDHGEFERALLDLMHEDPV